MKVLNLQQQYIVIVLKGYADHESNVSSQSDRTLESIDVVV
jgi:hypothetical protein